MTEIKKILVPVDFPDLSIQGLEAANRVATILDAKVTPAHVHVPVPEIEEPYPLTMGTSVYHDLKTAEKVSGCPIFRSLSLKMNQTSGNGRSKSGKSRAEERQLHHR